MTETAREKDELAHWLDYARRCGDLDSKFESETTHSDMRIILDHIETLERERDEARSALLAAERRGIERAAEVARAHKGSAAKRRREKFGKLSRFTPDAQDEIQAEERGEDIAAELIAAAILALLPEGDGWMPTHRHRKRGTEYVLIGFGKMQTHEWVEDRGAGWAPLGIDMREVAIYRSHDGSLWVRPREEFEDGRFETLPNPPTAKEE